MNRFKALIITLAFLMTAALEASAADDPWWDTSSRGEATLPELIADGWEIVGYSVSHGERSLSRDHVLQHPDKVGAWHCNYFSVVTSDNNHDVENNHDIITSCTPIRQP